MSTLAELPEIVGFFSYSREDDESYKGRLSALREAIQEELGAQLGRSKATFRLWQDKQAITPGKLWESEINAAVNQSVFFIPIVTPRMINSRYCHFEFDAFLAREKALERTDLVFPILYVPVAALESETQWRDHAVLSVIGKRQYVNWQIFRYSDVQSPVLLEAIARFCGNIVEALHQPVPSAEERRRRQMAQAPSNPKSRPTGSVAADGGARGGTTGQHAAANRPENRSASPNRPLPAPGPESAKPARAAHTGRFGTAMATMLPAPADATAPRTVFGLPIRTIVPIAGAMALIAGVAVTLMFLLPEQGPAADNPAPIVSKMPAASESALAQPPRHTNADPSLVLAPADLYQERSDKSDSPDKQ